MHIVGFVAENYKRLRLVQITPKGRVVQITGKNGQGKTSVLDAVWSALVGAKAIPEKPVRKGADKARIKLNLGELTVLRTIGPTGTHTLTVENAKGTKIASPQAMLDELLGELSFDPLAFVHMKPKEQVEMLRKVAKLDLDVDAMNAANEKDYADRTIINREVKRLETEVAMITVQAGLPKERMDEDAVHAKIKAGNEANVNAAAIMTAKNQLAAAVTAAEGAVKDNERFITDQRAKIAEIENELRNHKALLQRATDSAKDFAANLDKARQKWSAAPSGEPVDLMPLAEELRQVQLTNREIDKRERRTKLEGDLRKEQNKAADLGRAIERRNEEKATAIAGAQMPVPGLSFDENAVHFNAIPLEQLGEAEQIRISTAIAMAANPKLRVLRIMHGEAMDDDSLKILADMAEQHDFQIWMAKVDSSGKVGIVLEDGMVVKDEDGD